RHARARPGGPGRGVEARLELAGGGLVGLAGAAVPRGGGFKQPDVWNVRAASRAHAVLGRMQPRQLFRRAGAGHALPIFSLLQGEIAVVHEIPQRVTRTGSLDRDSTRVVSLPSSSPPTAPRPCEAMAMASHFAVRASRRMPACGCSAVTMRVSHATP